MVGLSKDTSADSETGRQPCSGRTPGKFSMRSLGLRFLLALVPVMLLFAPYAAVLFKKEPTCTAHSFMWERADSVWLVIALLAIAGMAVALGEVIRWLGRDVWIRIFNHAFVVAVGAGLITNFWFHLDRDVGYHPSQHGMEVHTLWLILIGIVAFSLGRKSDVLVVRTRQVAQIASPFAVILLVQILTLQTYPSPIDPFPAAAPEPMALTGSALPTDTGSARPFPIYMLIFDEWSYERSYENGRLLPLFEHLRLLSDRSMVFHNADSPGGGTTVSIPRLLFQTSLEPTIDDGKAGFLKGDRFFPAGEFDSLFLLADERDYTTFMIGSNIPYKMWLGDQMDVCRAHRWYSHPRSAQKWIWPTRHLFTAMRFWGDEWSTLAHRKIRQKLDRKNFAGLHEQMMSDFFEVIRHQPEASFLIGHYMLPHPPYVWDAEGNWRPHDRWYESDVGVYRFNLALMDKQMRRLVEAMEEVDRFDDALLILTSDHTWRLDPGRDTGEITCELTHVPLIIKLPGQQKRVDVSARFNHLQMAEFLRYVLDGGRDPEGALAAVGLDPSGAEGAVVAAGLQSRGLE